MLVWQAAHAQNLDSVVSLDRAPDGFSTSQKVCMQQSHHRSDVPPNSSGIDSACLRKPGMSVLTL